MSERVPEDLVQWADRTIDDLVAAGTVAETARCSLNVHLVGAIELGIQRGAALTLAPYGADEVVAPVPMRLRCPQCNTLHIDEGEFATRPHKTHTCQSCGEHFQPALVPTVGVKFLPGCESKKG